MADEYDPEVHEGVVKRRATKAQLKREQELEDIRNMLKFPGNRAFLWRLLEKCGVLRRIASLDDVAMRLAAGRLDVGLELIDELTDADPLAFINLQREAKQKVF